MGRIDPESLSILKDKVIFINRVAKVVKGGRRFSFSALVVVGDEEGHVGFGKGKAQEVPEAIRKAVEHARRSLVKVTIKDGTIPHQINGTYGAGKIVMVPARPGIVAKSIGSRNHFNTVRATINGLTKLKDSSSVARRTGKTEEKQQEPKNEKA